MRLFRRGRTWYATFYENGERVQRTTKCMDRRAAELVAREWERDAADPETAVLLAATLSEALELLLRTRSEEARAGRRSQGTVDFYRTKCGHLTRVFEHDEHGTFKPFRLAALRARDVDGFISTRRVEGAAENTINKELIALRASLKLARRAGLWRGDPAAICPIAFAPEYKPRKRALSPSEVQRLVAQLTADRAAAVAFMIATSAEWGAVVRAQRADIDASARLVLVRGTKRTTRWREVPLVSDAQRTLIKYAIEHAQGVDGALFLPWQNVRRDLAQACDRAGIEPCTPNDLRRTCATWLRQLGAPPDLIAPVMGHADTRMVERVYGRLPINDLTRRLQLAIGQTDCSTGATDCSDSGGFLALNAPTRDDGNAKTPAVAEAVVPRDRIELPTRGFSILGRCGQRCGKTWEYVS
jgi:integrase